MHDDLMKQCQSNLVRKRLNELLLKKPVIISTPSMEDVAKSLSYVTNAFSQSGYKFYPHFDEVLDTPDWKEFKVGQTVFDVRHGWGVICAIEECDDDYPIEVHFSMCCDFYTINGFHSEKDYRASLSHFDYIDSSENPVLFDLTKVPKGVLLKSIDPNKIKFK